MLNFPEWLNTNENYSAVKDSTSFVDKSITSFKNTVFHLRSKGSGYLKENPVSYFAFIIVTVVLMSLSRNMLFTYMILSLLILRIAILKTEDMKTVLKNGLRAFAFSILMLLPTVLMSQNGVMMTIAIKVFVSVSLVSIYNTSYNSDELISCFKKLRVPDLIIYIFDTAIKYIIVFSKSASELLTSLKCRIIGKLSKKDQSISNIMGITYLKSVRMSKEMLEAMECRGFVGEYKILTHDRFSKYDLFRILIIVLEIILCIYLGV